MRTNTQGEMSAKDKGDTQQGWSGAGLRVLELVTLEDLDEALELALRELHPDEDIEEVPLRLRAYAAAIGGTHSREAICRYLGISPTVLERCIEFCRQPGTCDSSREVARLAWDKARRAVASKGGAR